MKVQLIIGSTRPSRMGKQFADWVIDNLPKNNIEYELIDLLDFNLPLLDEPIMASQNKYQNKHTKVWSEKIKQADGYIWLTPEYNAGYSAALKNAIDYLYHEWTNKPIMIISYGAGGGSSASAQLRQVAERLKMQVVKEAPAIKLPYDSIDESGKIVNIDEALKSYLPDLQTASNELNSLLNKDSLVVTE